MILHYLSYTLGVIYAIAYIISAIEIIGSWWLTKYKHGVEWNIMLNIILPLVIPFLAFIAASDITYSAQELYAARKYNRYHYQESLYAYLYHHGRTIDEWAELSRFRKAQTAH